MASAGTGRLALMLTSVIFLTACEEGSGNKLFSKPLFQNNKNSKADTSLVPQETATTIIERDVEAPDVFQQTEAGLWDGRPSLGGVWVAHPDVADPERVIIRNETNGKFVIGALFRRERDTPGPRFQVSSDAAETLGMLAGAPTDLNVTALRREQVPVVPEVSDPPLDATETIEQTTLDPVAAAASSAIIAAEAEAASGTAQAVAAAVDAPISTPKPAPVPTPGSTLAKPYIQIGIFSIQSNADRTADLLRKAGVVPTIKPGNSSGKAFWRVVVGPAATAGERTTLIKKVKALGFNDAYSVTN